MELDKLWAPWRIGYITNPKAEGCFLCEYSADSDDKKHLILHRGKSAFVIMNYYPYNNGHLMVAPYQHVRNLNDLDESTRLEIFDLIDKSCQILHDSLNAEGFNVGLNLGSVAGAGLKDHLHFHIVPRWTGDTNFMPITGHTKVLREGLTETWQRLRPKFEK
ncbi:MAG: HIT domain-containing protein [Candidatus Neomarinimicrobiota bacterium]|jgi:ATP adenylyltransferase